MSEAGKGDKSRVSDFESYWNSPIWDNLGKDKNPVYELKLKTGFKIIDCRGALRIMNGDVEKAEKWLKNKKLKCKKG